LEGNLDAVKDAQEEESYNHGMVRVGSDLKDLTQVSLRWKRWVITCYFCLISESLPSFNSLVPDTRVQASPPLSLTSPARPLTRNTSARFYKSSLAFHGKYEVVWVNQQIAKAT